MPDSRRTPRRLAAYFLAVPVIVLVYIGAFGSRIWAALRPAVATFLGATVIGTVYADEALKRAPATPMRAAAVLALAVALVGPGMAPPPASAASDPAQAVIAAARVYLGVPYKLGTEGPDKFDCSGFLFRVFSDVGQLPRIGGSRLLARGYMRWFVSRGLFTRDVDKAEPGDLVVWDMGEHIGIYLGGGKAISALVNPYGITIHTLHGIRLPVDYFLQVDWRNGDGPPDPDPGDPPGDPPVEPPGDPGAGPGNGDSTGSGQDNPGEHPGDGTDGPPVDPGDGGQDNPDDPGAQPNDGKRGISTGVLNMRLAADPAARIVGWLGRGKTFQIVASGNSPAGYLWYEVRTVSGKQGWIYAYWTRPLN